MNQYSFGFSKRRVAPALALLAAAALLAPCAAQATPFVIHMVQQGSDVVATGSGAIDTSRLGSVSETTPLFPASVYPAAGVIIIGSNSSADLYQVTFSS